MGGGGPDLNKIEFLGIGFADPFLTGSFVLPAALNVVSSDCTK